MLAQPGRTLSSVSPRTPVRKRKQPSSESRSKLQARQEVFHVEHPEYAVALLHRVMFHVEHRVEALSFSCKDARLLMRRFAFPEKMAGDVGPKNG